MLSLSLLLVVLLSEMLVVLFVVLLSPEVRLFPLFSLLNVVSLKIASTSTFLAGSDGFGTASIRDLVVLEDDPAVTESVPFISTS